MDQSRKIPIGKVARAHGIKGEVKVLPYPLLNFEVITRIPRFYRRLGREDYEILEVEKFRPAPGEGYLFKFKGIDDRDAAEKLHDIELFVNLEDLPPKEENEFYVFELIGLKVILPDGKELGEVVGLMPVGPYELLEVRVEPRKTIYLPMVEDIISEIDLKKGVIYATPPPDLLESQL